MIEIGRDQFRRVEIADASGEVLLTIERLASGNVMVEGRIYNRDGQLIVSIDPDGLREVGPAAVMLGGGPPG